MADYRGLELRTERLVLRPYRESDVGALFALYSDPQVTRYLSRPAWTDLAQARERMAQDDAWMANGEVVRLALERADDGAFLGECCLFHFESQCRRAELGYALAREAWGAGYMHEALSAVVRYAFTTLGLNRLEADIDPRNVASAKSLERLGFQREGLLRERWIVAGEVSDTGFYGLLRREWEAHDPS